MKFQIDTESLDQCRRAALGLLRQRYRVSDGEGGGWYHQLEKDDPGATATALGLMVLDAGHERYEHFDEALAFLKARQVASDDPLQDGGWATNSSLGHPVVEATGWVARMIGVTRCNLAPDAPDATRARRWLVNNQNPDGGWGSLRGCPSRVWLTCVALRGLAALDPHDAAIARGVEWLMASRGSQSPGWGELPSAPATVTHTAFVLLTLAELRIARDDDRLERAYTWLSAHLDATQLDDHGARLELYVATCVEDGKQITWRAALWHYGLPAALVALLQDPSRPDPALIGTAVETIIRTQLEEGHWPSAGGGNGISLWGVWWCLEALTLVRREPMARDGDLIIWLPDAVVVQRGNARDKPLTALIAAEPRLDLRALLARHWAALVLTVFVLFALIAVAAHDLSWQEFAVGLIVPIALFGIEQVRHHR